MRAAGRAALALALALAAAPAAAQGIVTGGDNAKPIGITADNGIEWQQQNHVYIARGDASATRGDDKVTADSLYAYYRSVAASDAGHGAAPPQHGQDPLNQGSNQIYRIEAQGNVRFTAPGEAMTGDHGVYDVAGAVLVVTGRHLELQTQHQQITARDSLEWYDQKQLGVARGDAVAVEGDRALHADVLTAHVEKAADGSSRIGRIDADGHVLVSAPDEIGRADAGVYDLDTGIVTLSGHVELTRGGDELTGRYAVIDLKNDVSRLLAAPPGVAGTGRVEGLIVPRQEADQK